jgi:thiol-disulfide isomerase/thioredoxin
MRIFLYLILLLAAKSNLLSQIMPDFTVVDTDLKIHNLYADYLDKGKVVVVKIFFVDCPPCNAIAPSTQAKYVRWGEGKDRVQFIEMSTLLTDRNSHVREYKLKHGITFPSISGDGGGFDAAKIFTNGSLGRYSGTPLFVVITPDKKYTYEVLFSQLDNYIEDGLKITTATKPAKISFKVEGASTGLPSNVNFILTSDTTSANAPRYNITQLTSGTNSFDYPSTQFPKINKPIIILESKAKAFASGINVADLVAMKNHIVGSVPFTTDQQKVASDLNNSGTINAADLVALQRVILQVTDSFPNDTPSYKMIPAKISVDFASGSVNELNTQLVKLGNVKL